MKFILEGYYAHEQTEAFDLEAALNRPLSKNGVLVEFTLRKEGRQVEREGGYLTASITPYIDNKPTCTLKHIDAVIVSVDPKRIVVRGICPHMTLGFNETLPFRYWILVPIGTVADPNNDLPLNNYSALDN